MRPPRKRRFETSHRVAEVSGRFVNRGNLRDVVMALSLGLALIHQASMLEIIASLVLLAFGCALHFISKGVLIRNLVLCREGVYAIVRHPYYLANYLIDTSFCLMSGSILLVGAYPFLFFWAYGPTMRKEERELLSRHPDEAIKASLDIPLVFPDADSVKAWPDIFAGFSLRRISSREMARITRFWAVEFLFMLLNDLKEEGLREFISPRDYDGVALAAAFLFLSLVSVVLVRFGALGRRAG
jgi:hypothetical protein